MPPVNSVPRYTAALQTDLDTARRILKASSHFPALDLLACLVDGPRDVGSLARSLNLSVPTTSRELASLRRVGLVTAQKSRNRRVYSLSSSISLDLKDHVCHLRIALPDAGGLELVLPAAKLSDEKAPHGGVVTVRVGDLHDFAAKGLLRPGIRQTPPPTPDRPRSRDNCRSSPNGAQKSVARTNTPSGVPTPPPEPSQPSPRRS